MNSSLYQRARNFCLFRAPALFPLIVCAFSGYSQEQPATTNQASATISVDVRLVVLHTSVRNNRGGIVSGLKERNFRVEEDGRPQVIRAFHSEDIPVAVGLVVDNSGSMTKKRSDVSAAASAFARSSNQGDEMFIVNFNDHVTLGLPDTKLFSASVDELESALLTPVPTGRTALYDAIINALAHIERSSNERKALVMFSDGGDNASKHTLNQVLQAVAQSGVTVYTIGLFDEEDPDRNPRVLRQIADASGGRAFLQGMSAGTMRICEHIAKDIRTQYTIAYSPSNQNFNGAYRTIKVSVRADHGVKLQARTRAGYMALPDAPSTKDGR
jgi:Ca-activated chloride channel homolog